MEHLQRVWLASRERLPFRAPGSVPILGLTNAPIVETKFLELAMSLLDFSPRIPLGTFSILLPIVNFPRLSGDVPRLPSYVVYISQLVRFARCCTSVFDFNSKKIQITSKLLTQGYRYHIFGKRLGSSLGHTLKFCPNLVKYRFRIMYHKELLTLPSTVILSTNFGGSKAKRISSRRDRKK